jgi:hypothetical protein
MQISWQAAYHDDVEGKCVEGERVLGVVHDHIVVCTRRQSKDSSHWYCERLQSLGAALKR